jgi:hypothetical protein
MENELDTMRESELSEVPGYWAMEQEWANRMGERPVDPAFEECHEITVAVLGE